jgi:predicted nuclease with TOPRIM domain
MHTDKDGVTREYACCDVLLWTAIYQQEALDIVNCGESMELYVDSIDGKWEYINGQKYFVFTEGCFLGLQALGEEFEPCFEGAGFYELDTDKLANRLEQFELLSNAEVGGEEQMNFKLSDNQKYNMIWQLLNTRCNEADGYIIDYGICEVYDNYAIVFKYESGNYERAYYTKDDATDSLSIDKMETCYIVDVNENEKKALEVLHQMNGDTYEKIDENYTSLQDSVNTLTEEKTTLESEKETFSQKIEEQDAAISTLEQEKADVTNELNDVKGNFDAAQSTIQTLTEENKDLTEFKSKILKAEKEAVIEHFSALLDADTIAQFQDKLDEWTKEELEKELSYTLVQSKPSIFSYNQEDPAYVPKDNTTILEGVDGIISRYKK